MKSQPPSTRLFAILARNAPIAVVFRRGPSKQVLLIKWNLEDDSFEYGQWLKARIYERRCDLSPSGNLLLYFAASQKKPYYSWSAISRPPYLTALALWPKGDCWGGGGLFDTDKKISLNHGEQQKNLAPEFTIPKWLSVQKLGFHSGRGEDDPVWAQRLARDGWTQTSAPKRTKDDHGAKVWIEYSPPIGWRKPHPTWPKRYSLEMSITGIKEKDGPWYLIEHALQREGGSLDKIGRSDWADWSPNGDLLFAMNGCLYRLPCAKGILPPLEHARKIADFGKLRFENCAPPASALVWPRGVSNRQSHHKSISFRLNMSDRQEPLPVIRKLLPFTTVAIVIALGYLVWVFYSRWQENRQMQQQAAAKQQAEAKRIYDLYGSGRVKILQLYASPGLISRGGRSQLCYGVSNAKSMTITPKPAGDVWPSIARCVDIAPTEDTTYVLTAEDANGHTETANVTVQVK